MVSLYGHFYKIDQSLAFSITFSIVIADIVDNKLEN